MLDTTLLTSGWKSLLKEEFSKDYFLDLSAFLAEEISEGKQIYPPRNLIFNAFNFTPLEEVKVVILGQDPYHKEGQAMGLSFSVPPEQKIPASLRNVYKELQSDLGIEKPVHGDLSSWAKQGVFLLNAMLTVEHSKAGSHRKKGWQLFTDKVIQKLSEERDDLVFMLWGNFAKAKGSLIDENKHLILGAVHPSPLAGNGFLGNQHFSKCNEYLQSKHKEVIDWSLPLPKS